MLHNLHKLVVIVIAYRTCQVYATKPTRQIQLAPESVDAASMVSGQPERLMSNGTSENLHKGELAGVPAQRYPPIPNLDSMTPSPAVEKGSRRHL